MSELQQKSELLQIANQYGNVSVECGVPTGYEHIRGARLQPLCRKCGIEYANARVGWGGTRKHPKPILDGVVVKVGCATRLRTAVAERDQRSAVRRERENRKQDKEKQKLEHERAMQMEQKRSSFRETFPAATDAIVEKFINGTLVFATVEEIPLNILSLQEIKELQLISHQECGVLLTNGGATVVPLFTAIIGPDESSESTNEDVHGRAVNLGFTAQRALWALNKLVKTVQRPPKKEVYSIKDQLLAYWSEYLIEGRVVRSESKSCWTCDGSGVGQFGGDCDKCFGSGVYSSSTLYEVRYKFPDDERTYCYHTYSKPASLSDEPGVNKPSYGGRFTPDDRKQVPFSFHDLMRIVRHEMTLNEEVAKERERVKMLNQWSQFGLPPVRSDANTPQIRKCLKLIEQLTRS